MAASLEALAWEGYMVPMDKPVNITIGRHRRHTVGA
jgi:hypothetical protein